MRHMYSDDEFLRKVEEYNEETTLEMIPKWCCNVADNLAIARGAKSISQYPTMESKKKAILVGAGWSLNDEDIKKLAYAKDCDIIVCNKSYERLVSHLVSPRWVVLLDADAISAPQFEFLKNYRSFQLKPNFFIASTVYPRTLRLIKEYLGDREDLYIFNPETDVNDKIPIEKTWEWMNFKQTFKHGGNVGGTMIDLAMYLNYDEIAFLGFDFCEKPDPKWEMAEAVEREHMFYPDQNEFVSVPFNFLCYSHYVLNRVRTFVSVPGKKAVNLAESALMRHCPYLEQRKVGEYVELL